MALDLSKPVQTREGLKVEILKTGYVSAYLGPQKIIYIVYEDKENRLLTCDMNGRFYTSDGIHKWDLVNVPEKHKGWFRVYKYANIRGHAPRQLIGPYASKSIADGFDDKCNPDYVGAVELEITDPV